MTTRTQDEAIDNLGSRFGGTHVLPADEDGAVLACGWEWDGSEPGGEQLSPWFRVERDSANEPGLASLVEVAEALVRAEYRGLLS